MFRFRSGRRSSGSPTIPWFLVLAGPTFSGVRVTVESGLKVAVRRSSGSSNPVAADTGKADLERVALGAQGVDVRHLLRFRRRNHRGLAVKSNGTPSTSAYSASKRPPGFRS